MQGAVGDAYTARPVMKVLRPLCAVAACLAVAAGFAFVAGTGHRASASAVASNVLIPISPGQVFPLSGGTVKSGNWSGYAVRSAKHKISGVSGTFTIPSAGNSGQLAATWAGIGGFKTNDLIQAGTAEDATPGLLGGKKYFAWFELLPHPESKLKGCKGDSSCAVSPGQHISVTIRNTGGSTWSIAVNDQGHWSWSRTVHYHSSHSSAEWILEAPTLIVLGVPQQSKLSNVGTVHFAPTSEYMIGGGSHTIAQGHPVRILLTNKGGGGQATPSALSGGRLFNDCAYKSSCAKP